MPPPKTFILDPSDQRSDLSSKTATGKGPGTKVNPWLIQHRYNKSFGRTPIKEGTDEPSDSPSPAVLIFRENADVRIRRFKGDNQLLTESACEKEFEDSYAFKEVPLKSLCR